MIEVPPKIWQPKVINQFRMPTYNDVDNGIFQFQAYGKCVYRDNWNWDACNRSDIIHYDSEVHHEELQRDLKIGQGASPDDCT